MINEITIIGNIGADAQDLTTASGKRFTKFTVATNDRYTDPQGQWQTSTEWHTVKVWGAQAQNAFQRCKKGKKVYVRGKMTSYKSEADTRLWEVRCYIFKILDKDERDHREDVQVQHKPQHHTYGSNQPAPSWGAPIK